MKIWDVLNGDGHKKVITVFVEGLITTRDARLSPINSASLINMSLDVQILLSLESSRKIDKQSNLSFLLPPKQSGIDIHALTMPQALGTPLKDVTAAFWTQRPGSLEYHHLLRVVQVVGLEKQKLSLPAREIWAGRTSDNDKIEYLTFDANDAQNGQEESATLKEANSLISDPPALLTSLAHTMPSSELSRWYATKRVIAHPCIWERKIREDTGNAYYIINETKLRV